MISRDKAWVQKVIWYDSCLLAVMHEEWCVSAAGLQSFETFLYNTSVLYSLLVAYALVQALVLTLMLCSFIQRW